MTEKRRVRFAEDVLLESGQTVPPAGTIGRPDWAVPSEPELQG
jgi:hypothetical protein